MEKAIKIAIENGWGNVPEKAIMEMLPEMCIGFHMPGSDRGIQMSIHTLLLQPEFWQTLGKGLGWKVKGEEFLESCTVCGDDYYNRDEWRWHWYRFIDHLAEGKDIDSFFKELLK